MAPALPYSMGFLAPGSTWYPASLCKPWGAPALVIHDNTVGLKGLVPPPGPRPTMSFSYDSGISPSRRLPREPAW